MQAESSFADTFAAALRSGDCTVIGLHPEPTVVPVGEWTAPAGPLDLAILDLCDGPTLDIGCGPGRMATALAERGQIVLGIDVVAEAVQQTNRRGAAALLRDVFANVPAEGRWSTVLLADGNLKEDGSRLVPAIPFRHDKAGSRIPKPFPTVPGSELPLGSHGSPLYRGEPGNGEVEAGELERLELLGEEMGLA